MPKVFLLILIFSSQALLAQPGVDLAKADLFYDKGQEDQSLQLYEKVFMDDKKTTPKALYRMAFMEENKGNIAKTLYYLSLLESVSPNDAIRNRIEALARQYKLQGYEFDEVDLLKQGIKRFKLVILLFYFSIIAILTAILVRRRVRNKPLRLLPASLGILLLFAAFLLNYDIKYGKAVVLFNNLPVRPTESASAPVEYFVPAGTRLTVTSVGDIYVQVIYKGNPLYVSREWVGYY